MNTTDSYGMESFDTEQYQRSAKRKNCYIKARSQGRTFYCKIKGLVTLKQCNCVIQHHFLSQVSESSQLVVSLQLHEIVSKCIKVEHNNKMYLIDMQNMVEME